MQELEKILEEIDEATRQEDAPIYCGSMEVDGYVRMSVVRKIIRKHINDGWIPVEGKMPEGKALVCDKYGEMMIGYICGSANGGYDCEGDGCEMFNVLAWQTLPEPYRPERSKK